MRGGDLVGAAEGFEGEGGERGRFGSEGFGSGGFRGGGFGGGWFGSGEYGFGSGLLGGSRRFRSGRLGNYRLRSGNLGSSGLILGFAKRAC